MTVLSAVTSTTNATATTQKHSTTVDYESFLKLLVTQMKNQDPTKPMDSTDYVAQLATFSQVEQTVQTNARLEQLMQMTMLGQADAVIGRTVTSADGLTTGVVEEVRIGSAGIIAVLESGAEIEMGPGVTVR
jgi:flagellar basal-body rod modification protein FlgD